MNKKIMLLVLAAVSAAVLALPAMASALVPLHTSKLQTGTVSGGAFTFSKTGGTTVTCETTTGTTTSTTTTTGTLVLLFHGCKSSGISCNSTGQPAGTIETTVLTYHLLTLTEKKPGILLTPNESTGVIGHFTCSFLSFTWEGNGLLGTITSPECGKSSTSSTWSFKATGLGVQQHTTVEGTATKYQLISGGQNMAWEMTLTDTTKETDTFTCT
jgi:hypothetical protein